MTNPAIPTPPPPVFTPFARNMLTAFGLGHIRPFPGTWGSLFPLPIAVLFLLLSGGDAGFVYNLALICLLVAFTTACATHGDFAEAHFRRKDPSDVVADEVAGMSIALLALPVGSGAGATFAAILTAFIAFRLFDIVKPWPCKQIQSVPGGWGIVLDDLAAGVYALIATQLIWRVLI